MNDIVKLHLEAEVENARENLRAISRRGAGMGYGHLYIPDAGPWPRTVNGEEVSFREAEEAYAELERQHAVDLQSALAVYTYHLRRLRAAK